MVKIIEDKEYITDRDRPMNIKKTSELNTHLSNTTSTIQMLWRKNRKAKYILLEGLRTLPNFLLRWNPTLRYEVITRSFSLEHLFMGRMWYDSMYFTRSVWIYISREPHNKPMIKIVCFVSKYSSRLFLPPLAQLVRVISSMMKFLLLLVQYHIGSKQMMPNDNHSQTSVSAWGVWQSSFTIARIELNQEWGADFSLTSLKQLADVLVPEWH